MSEICISLSGVTIRACIVGLSLVCTSYPESNFSSGPAALKFGVHEIVLEGNGAASNPFDTALTVTFAPPSGASSAVTVEGFYDGGDTWKARVYVSEPGIWKWQSRCASDRRLDAKSGEFTASNSALRGMLRKHKANPQAWMTDDGRWFANISDTAYRLFHGVDAPLWQQFVRDDAAKGISCLRVAGLGGWGGTPGAKVDDNNYWVWNDPWAGGGSPDYSRYDLAKFQNSDSRLIWMLDNYPEMYLQFILFSFKGYGTDGTGKWWFSLPPPVRTKTMRYMIARWSAFPNLFWLIVNDMHCSLKFPNNQAFAREVGKFFEEHDPWRHLMSTGPNRWVGFPFTGEEDLKWCSYIYIEDSNAVGADEIREFHFDDIPLHVWMGEDYYEQDYGHYADARFFFRWLFWSWLLTGGSANYGGRWGVIHPYSQTWGTDLHWTGAGGIDYSGEQLTGLDSVPYIRPYFRDRRIDLGYFQPEDSLVKDLDGRNGQRRPKLAHRGNEEFLIYHPNATSVSQPADGSETKSDRKRAEGRAHIVDRDKTARMRVDLRAALGTFGVEWFRPHDGTAQDGGTVEGGGMRDLAAPWKGFDVVLRLVKRK
jgi:hypothetical protein